MIQRIRICCPPYVGKRTLLIAASLFLVAGAFALPPAEANDLCGATITAGTVLTRNQMCTGNGITIGADNVTLDLNGFSIIGPVTVTLGQVGGRCSAFAGDILTTGVIVSGRTGVTIKGPGSIQGFGKGVFITGGTNNQVRNGVKVTKNVSNGIQLVSTTQNIIKEDDISLNCGFGVELIAAHGNQITENICDKNSGPPSCACVSLLASNNNEIKENKMDQNGDVGVRVAGSNGNTIEENVITNTNFLGSPTPGIVVDGSSQNAVTENTSNSNSHGIILSFSSANTLKENTALTNTVFDLAEIPIPNAPCPNTWLENVFVTKNATSCIQ